MGVASIRSSCTRSYVKTIAFRDGCRLEHEEAKAFVQVWGEADMQRQLDCVAKTRSQSPAAV